jgi:hypothetical protein
MSRTTTSHRPDPPPVGRRALLMDGDAMAREHPRRPLLRGSRTDEGPCVLPPQHPRRAARGRPGYRGRTLVAAGHDDSVIRLRQKLLETMRLDLIAAMDRLTDRRMTAADGGAATPKRAWASRSSCSIGPFTLGRSAPPAIRISGTALHKRPERITATVWSPATFAGTPPRGPIWAQAPPAPCPRKPPPRPPAAASRPRFPHARERGVSAWPARVCRSG